MALYINQDGEYLKFYTDENARFVMAMPDMKESVILAGVSSEYDGICDDEGNLHFLIQSMQGELLYLRYESSTWKKYNIFKNKDNLCKISNIILTYSGSVMCAFYAMEHSGRIMLVKHTFSSTRLYATPEIADLTDARKDFCVCSCQNGDTHLFYRDSAGRRQEIVYDKYFVKSDRSTKAANGEIYNMCVVSCKNKMLCAYISMKKSYTALMFSTYENIRQEKIITFGLAKNTEIAMSAADNEIIIRWRENGIMMQSVSKNGGETFSKPHAIGRNSEFKKIRSQGLKAGMHHSHCAAGELEKKSIIKQTDVHERMKNMNTRSGFSHSAKEHFNDMGSADLCFKLTQIEAEVDKIGKDMDKICMFLDRLVRFKEKSTEAITQKDIGEKNEENIRLFESMDIDDVLTEKSGEEIILSEDDENE